MKRKLDTLKAIALGVTLLLIAILFIFNPARYANACLQGFLLWAECVLPSLFPFSVLTLLFTQSGLAEKVSLPLQRVARRLRLPQPFAVCLLISLFSGYPTGSRVLLQLHQNGALSKDETARLAFLCSTAGPLFAVGTVGGKLLGDGKLGLLLFAVHLLSVLVIGYLFARKKNGKDSVRSTAMKRSKNLLHDCFASAVLAVCVAGGYIAFFCCLAQMLSDCNLLLPLQWALAKVLPTGQAQALCSGLIEATTGCALSARCGGAFALPITGFLLTFGGASILAQQLGYLQQANVKPLPFIGIKALQALLCFLILLPISLILT